MRCFVWPHCLRVLRAQVSKSKLNCLKLEQFPWLARKLIHHVSQLPMSIHFTPCVEMLMSSNKTSTRRHRIIISFKCPIPSASFLEKTSALNLMLHYNTDQYFALGGGHPDKNVSAQKYANGTQSNLVLSIFAIKSLSCTLILFHPLPLPLACPSPIFWTWQ